jgi:hypothetical protein
MATFGEGSYLEYQGEVFRIKESLISDDSSVHPEMWRVDIKAEPLLMGQPIPVPTSPFLIGHSASPWTDLKIRGFEPEEEDPSEWNGPLYDA